MIDLAATFEKFNDEYLKFEKIKNPPHSRPDISAFLVLDRLVPNPSRDIVSAAEHDEIWLETNCELLAEVATDDDVLMLVRCGVSYDSDLESLGMFV